MSVPGRTIQYLKAPWQQHCGSDVIELCIYDPLTFTFENLLRGLVSDIAPCWTVNGWVPNIFLVFIHCLNPLVEYIVLLPFNNWLCRNFLEKRGGARAGWVRSLPQTMIYQSFVGQLFFLWHKCTSHPLLLLLIWWMPFSEYFVSLFKYVNKVHYISILRIH